MAALRRVETSATTGLPHVMVRRNMQRVAGVMREMSTVLGGLTRVDAVLAQAIRHFDPARLPGISRASWQCISCPTIRPVQTV